MSQFPLQEVTAQEIVRLLIRRSGVVLQPTIPYPALALAGRGIWVCLAQRVLLGRGIAQAVRIAAGVRGCPSEAG
jgi:hypothetical protein